jgi:thymidylate kinase
LNWKSDHAAAFAAITKALNLSGIRWLVLRNYKGLPKTNNSKDVDIGVNYKDIDTAYKIIGDSLALFGFDRVVTTEFSRMKCSTYFRISEEEVLSIKIDLMDGFTWWGVDFFKFDSIYQSSIRQDDVLIPNVVDNGLISWIKPLLTGGGIKRKYVQDINVAVQNFPEDFKVKLIEVFGVSLGSKVWHLIEHKRLTDTIALRRQLTFALWWKSAYRHPLIIFSGVINHIYMELKRRVIRSPGSMFVVVGPDGVGKTTFIKFLQDEISRILIKDLDAVEVKHFRPHVLPNIKEIFYKSSQAMQREDFQRPHRAPPVGQFSSFLRITYYWLDYFLGYWLINRKKCIAGKILIFDRYFYDFIVDPRRSRIDLPQWIRRFFLAITPSPDLVFFLDCDAETVFKRKQELPMDEIARQLQEYRYFVLAFPGRFIGLDARQPPEISCRCAINSIISHSFRRV